MSQIDNDRQLRAIRESIPDRDPTPPEMREEAHTPPPVALRHVWRLGKVVDGTGFGAPTVYYEEGYKVVGYYFQEIGRLTLDPFAGSATHDDDLEYQLTHAYDSFDFVDPGRPVGSLFLFIWYKAESKYLIVDPPSASPGHDFHRTPDATIIPPLVGPLISKDPSMELRSYLTGVVAGSCGADGGTGSDLLIRYRNAIRRDDGTMKIEDEAASTIVVSGEVSLLVWQDYATKILYSQDVGGLSQVQLTGTVTWTVTFPSEAP